MNLSLLEKHLGILFNNKSLLQTALTHRSYLNETKNKNLPSNERLEFLGDAVLSLTVSKFLYEKFIEAKEGDLTNFRASLVKTKTLGSVAEKLKLGSYLFLSRGEEEEGGRENLGLLADTFEALVGAIFLDKGLLAAEDFIARHLFPLLPKIIQNQSFRDSKSLLQEKVQTQQRISPTYRVLKMRGPDHQRTFTVGVFCRKNKLAEGSGRSKQEAEEQAARAALEKLETILTK